MPNHAEVCPVCRGNGVFSAVLQQNCTAPTKTEILVCKSCGGSGFVVVSDGRGTAEIRALKAQSEQRLEAVRDVVKYSKRKCEEILYPDLEKALAALAAVWPEAVEK